MNISELQKLRKERIENFIATRDIEPIYAKNDQGVMENVIYRILHEYVYGIQKITNGRMSFEDVMDKLEGMLGKIRLRNWDNEKDQNIVYSVNFEGENGNPIYESVTKIGMPNSQVCAYMENGKYMTAIGIVQDDLGDIDTIRHTLFHELNHVLSRSIVEQSDLGSKRRGVNIPQERAGSGDTVIINGQDIDSNQFLFTGVSTKEKGRNGRAAMINNQIDEGFVELIAQEVFKAVTGRESPLKGRYSINCEIAENIMHAYGKEGTIMEYLKHSYTLIDRLENEIVENEQGNLLTYSNRTLRFQRNSIGFINEMCKMLRIDKEDLLRDRDVVAFMEHKISFRELLDKFRGMLGEEVTDRDARVAENNFKDYRGSCKDMINLKRISDRIRKGQQLERHAEER